MSSKVKYDTSKIAEFEQKLADGLRLPVSTRRRLVVDRAYAESEVVRLIHYRNGVLDPALFKQANAKLQEWKEYRSRVDSILGGN